MFSKLRRDLKGIPITLNVSDIAASLMVFLCLFLASCGGDYGGEPQVPSIETTLSGPSPADEAQSSGTENTNSNTETPVTNTESTLFKLQAASESYNQMCASCHGANGVDGRYGGLVGIGESLESLSRTIDLTMPTGDTNACIDECAENIAQLILLDFDLSKVESTDNTSNDGSNMDNGIDVGAGDESVSNDTENNDVSGSETGDMQNPDSETVDNPTPENSEPPSAFAEVTIALVNSVEAELTWQNSDPSISGFRIDQQVGTGSWQVIATRMGGMTAGSYRVTDLGENQKALFRIVAVNGNGETVSNSLEVSTEAFDGAGLYQYQCAACHGDAGNNGIERDADLTRDITQSELDSTVTRMIAEYSSCRFENCAARLVNFIREDFQQGPQANVQVDMAGSIEIFSNVRFSSQGSTDNSGIVSYQWNFGDGSQAVGESTVHQFTSVGTYTVALTVTDLSGWQDSSIVEVTVVDSNLPPVAQISATTTSGAAPLVVTLDGSGSSDPNGDALTYLWNFGDGTQAMGQSVVHTYSQGEYTAILTVSDTRAATNSAEVAITVSAPVSDDHPPMAVINASATTGQAPVTINFSGSGSTDPDNDISTYQWTVNGSPFSSSVSSSYQFTSGGDYNIGLLVTDSAKLVSQTSITVEIQDANLAPIAALNLNAHNSSYAPLMVNIDASGSSDDGSIAAYDIRVDGTSVSSSSTAQVTLDAGVHNIEVLVTDNDGLTDSNSTSLNVIEASSSQRNQLTLDILGNSCLSCHDNSWGALANEEELLTFANDLNSNVVTPGDADSSQMMMQIRSGNMPRGNNVISDQETLYLEYWIDHLGVAGDANSLFVCNEGSAPSVTPLRRLTKYQYTNTLHDLLGEELGVSLANSVMTQLEESLNTVPKENQAEGMNILDQRVDRAHVQGYFNVAIRLASIITEDQSLLIDFVGESCAADAGDEACLNRFFERWGPIVLRRPLTDEDRTFYATRISDYYSLISTLLLSPQFLYLQEFSGTPVSGGNNLVELDAWELASRLSYLFYQSMPDEALRNDAANGTLLNDSSYEAALNRVLGNSKARQRSDYFYREWLKLDEIPQINESGLVNGFDDFLTVDYGNGTALPANMNLASYREAAIREVLALTDYYTWQTEGVLSSLFTSQLSFADTADLASAYGVTPWQTGNYSQLVNLPSGERAGLLTRAALHIYGKDVSHPILKGVRIRREFLCDTLHPPQDNSTPEEAVILPEDSTRDKTSALTEIPGTACASCHAEQINHLGFPTESFDSLGRHRPFELILDDSGAEIARPLVNTPSTPRIEPTDNTMVADAVEFSNLIANHPKTSACFARQYFRYTYLRMEDLNQDGCVLQGLEQTLHASTLLDMMKQIALQPEFKMRQSTAP